MTRQQNTIDSIKKGRFWAERNDDGRFASEEEEAAQYYEQYIDEKPEYAEYYMGEFDELPF